MFLLPVESHCSKCSMAPFSPCIQRNFCLTAYLPLSLYLSHTLSPSLFSFFKVTLGSLVFIFEPLVTFSIAYGHEVRGYDPPKLLLPHHTYTASAWLYYTLFFAISLGFAYRSRNSQTFKSKSFLLLIVSSVCGFVLRTWMLLIGYLGLGVTRCTINRYVMHLMYPGLIVPYFLRALRLHFIFRDAREVKRKQSMMPGKYSLNSGSSESIPLSASPSSHGMSFKSPLPSRPSSLDQGGSFLFSPNSNSFLGSSFPPHSYQPHHYDGHLPRAPSIDEVKAAAPVQSDEREFVTTSTIPLMVRPPYSCICFIYFVCLFLRNLYLYFSLLNMSVCVCVCFSLFCVTRLVQSTFRPSSPLHLSILTAYFNYRNKPETTSSNKEKRCPNIPTRRCLDGS